MASPKKIKKQRSSRRFSPKKSKPLTFAEITPFFTQLLKSKVISDAQVGFDPERTLCLEQFTYQEFESMGKGDTSMAVKLMSEYMEALMLEVTGTIKDHPLGLGKLRTLKQVKADQETSQATFSDIATTNHVPHPFAEVLGRLYGIDQPKPSKAFVNGYL